VVREEVEGRAVTRQFSILTTGVTIGHFSLVIKVYPEGLMSRRVQGWGVGTRISCRGPFGCPPPLAGRARVVGLCQGTGLVPLLPLVEDVLEDQESDTIVSILYSCSSVDDLLLLDRLHELCSFWNCHLQIFLSSGEGLPGRVPQRTVVSHRMEREEVAREVVEGATYLVCGSKAYMAEMRGVLEEERVGREQVHCF